MISTAAARVFIVDDHPLIRESLAEYVPSQPGLAVCGTAASGPEALERLAGEDCNLALIDVSMPGMNGIELVRRLRALRPDLLCLMLSGHAEQVYVRDALRVGARGYVMKGDPDAIIAAVRHVLDGGTYLSERVRDLV